MMNGYVEKNCEFLRRRANDDCAFIAREIQNVALSLVYYCPTCGEDFTVHRENCIDHEFYRCPVCGDRIRFKEAKKMSLGDYFKNDFVLSYRMDSNMNYKSVELLLQRGAETYILDTQHETLCGTAGGATRIDMMSTIRKIDAFYRSVLRREIRRW